MDDLLTTKQLQDLLQVDRITIYRMLNDGRLRGFKVGGQWRFSRRDIERWLYGQQSDPVGAANTPTENTDFVSPAEMLPLSCIQAMQSVYAEALDIAAVTVDLDGVPLVPVSNSCDFCTLILATEEGQRRCGASWRQVEDGQFRRCHAGLFCASVPLLVKERRVANVACCQFVPAAGEDAGSGWRAGISELAVQLDLVENDLQKAAEGVPTLSEAALPRVLRLLWTVADTFGEIAQERARFVDRLHRIAEMTNL